MSDTPLDRAWSEALKNLKNLTTPVESPSEIHCLSEVTGRTIGNLSEVVGRIVEVQLNFITHRAIIVCRVSAAHVNIGPRGEYDTRAWVTIVFENALVGDDLRLISAGRAAGMSVWYFYLERVRPRWKRLFSRNQTEIGWILFSKSTIEHIRPVK